MTTSCAAALAIGCGRGPSGDAAVRRNGDAGAPKATPSPPGERADKSATPETPETPDPEASEPPALPKRTLAERLRDEVGKGAAVVILPGDEGVVAMSADGKRSRQIAAGKPYSVHVDNRSDVVWYQTGTQLRVLDLTSTEAEPAPVVVAEATTKFFDDLRVRYTAPPEELGFTPDPQVVVVIGASPHVEAAGERCKPSNAECPKLTDAGTSLLATLALRAKGNRLELPGGHTKAAKVAEAGECDWCGESETIPGTDLVAVKSETCGDYCHQVLGLFRPKTKEFVDPAQSKRQPGPFEFGVLADAWVCGTGDVFVDREGTAVRLTGGKFDAGGRSGNGGGGCLDGGWFFPDPDVAHQQQVMADRDDGDAGDD